MTKQYSIDDGELSKAVKGKRVLITGAGGSIGSELSRMVARGEPECLILLSHSEHTLFTIEQEIKSKFPEVKYFPVLADIRSQHIIQQTFERHRPDLVFHTAAIKHVPIAENHINEAVLTNLIGTRNVVDAVISWNTAQMIFISTDKAVGPTSIMGATKRAAERCCARGQSIKIVRFGNVIGSSGSVIPIFQKCIAEDRPLQVTHLEVDRYFMEISEAVALVLQAVNIDKGDNLFVLDMGKPVNIYQLAEEMVKKSGKTLLIEVTGLRPGEKIHEELFYPEEKPLPSRWDGILQGTPAQQINWLDATSLINCIESTAQEGDSNATLSILKQLVPEYDS